MQSLLEYVRGLDSERTIISNKWAIGTFLEFVQGVDRDGVMAQGNRRRRRTPDEYTALDVYSKEYLGTDRDHYGDFLNYLAFMKENKFAPLSIRMAKSMLYNWFVVNNIEVSAQQERILRRRVPKNKILTHDAVVTREDLKLIMEHAKMPLRAFIYCQISSGIRIGELLKIKDSHIDWDSSPVSIQISEDITKTREARFTFLSSEAVLSLKEWYRVREKWFASIKNKGKAFGLTKIKDDRVFPLTSVTMGKALSRVLLSAELFEKDEKTLRSTITTHSFRKFFNSQMKTSMPSEYVEFMMGHDGYLSKSYRRYSMEEIAKAYLQAEYTVCLHTPIDINEVLENKQAISTLTSEIARKEAAYAAFKEETERKFEETSSKLERMLDAQEVLVKMQMELQNGDKLQADIPKTKQKSKTNWGDE